MRKSRYDEGLVDEQIDIEINFLEFYLPYILNSEYDNDFDEYYWKYLKDLERALSCRDYDCDYYDIIKGYGCKTLKEFIGFVFASILKRYFGVKDIEKIESFIS